MFAIDSPFGQYFEKSGVPLSAGELYFGVANQNPLTSPITVYWDAAGTQPASQPIKTLNGYPVRSGTPAIVYISGFYSSIAKDSRGETVYYVADSSSLPSAMEAKLSATTGSSLVGFLAEPTAAVASTVQNKLRERVSILDFATPGTIGGGQNATAALLAAVDYMNNNFSNNNFKKQIFLPAGDYKFSRVELQSLRGLTFVGENTMDAIKRKTRWLYDGAAGDAALVIRSCAWVHFKGIHFENAIEGMDHLILFSANDSNALAPLNKFSNNWVTFEDCVFLSGGSLATPPSKLVWQKSCSNIEYRRCAFRPGSSTTALKIGADTDVDPDNGLPTFANGISAITAIDQCYFWGDIEREKSYATRVTNTQFSVHDADDSNSRLIVSGSALTLIETVENCMWDPTGIASYTGTLIEGGTSADCSGLRVIGNQLAGRLNLVKINRGDAVISGNRPISYGGSTSNVCVRIGASAGNVRVENNNESGYISGTVPGTIRARMVIDDRASKFGPVIAASELPVAVTLPAAGAYQSIRSQSHQFAGGYVRMSYSITIQHKDGGNTRAYTARILVNSVLAEGTVRRASATVADEYIVLAMTHVVYIDASDQAVTIELQAQQGSGVVYGIVQGADTVARSAWAVELLTH